MSEEISDEDIEKMRVGESLRFAGRKRTDLQNRALHQYFTLIAETLNEAGLDMKVMLPKFKVDVPWKPDTIKDLIWRPIQQAQFQKNSTTELTTKQLNEVFETLNRHLGKLGIHVPFPSLETEIWDKKIKKQK
jgi:hypothetical protein